ncbi:MULTISPECIES: SymE family type I addiction module toxin [Xanthomonas]|uniref:Toxin SymE-like domain-containing protein n=1 Tax=Xanthomonas phaseoli pv. dieffenbachiae TaxID=92828 RepID=A0A1V9HCR1_9XANT|nr:SymE family type I addiction module toxin [Xanthomonas phaseoli]MBO9769752.1 type I toxin-antitoxin system SymE family toxin [Xanthomonas phaseoli pv. dieffenbachiae]MBO9777780.1 type I toxin-antitoxin system SymE family toxin [Xanthomonas phaseoli pv. dieffenbachiae]MBO9782084.1 type I toxin-antitoxin system SymE family toxin [Xanthomonas phaseoli pv. dieffenbachiae]MBO9790151.1 type I toxin-antitoxin system SymE family toxin [Xanthomonas phaseoli pv. dieffenbachiae]MBO9798284.1 type I tox
MSRAPSPTAKRPKSNAKRAAAAKQTALQVKDAQPMRLVPSPTFDVDNLDFDRRHNRPRADNLPPRPPRKARTPTRCTVGYAFYDAEPGRPHSQRIPSVRLRGLWLEQLGFAIGCKLQITTREGELVVTVVER